MEKEIESYLKKEIERRGGLCLKFVSPGVTGVPDRVCVLPGGRVVFVEIKSADGELSPRQEYVIRQIRKRGHDVRVVVGKLGVDELIFDLRRCW